MLREFNHYAYGAVGGWIYGVVESNWYYKDEQIFFEFTVPDGVTADIILPDSHSQWWKI